LLKPVSAALAAASHSSTGAHRTGRMPRVERRPIACIQIAYGTERGQRGDIDKGIIGHEGLSSEGYGYRRPGGGQMEAYHIDRFGSVDGVVLRSSEDLRPGPKEILMRVRATSLNYRDLMVLKGGGRGPTKLGVVPLSDGAGEIAAIGAG
jgi:hypothetical protein